MNSAHPVTILTVATDGLFFTRLLVERVRAMMDGRAYEIIVVDRVSRDGTRAWLRAQQDVRVTRYPGWPLPASWSWRRGPWQRGHRHGEAAEAGARLARHERIVLLDSDAHPVSPNWLRESVDRLDAHHRLAGAVFRSPHKGNPHGWYIHPHFMAFLKADLGRLVILRKRHGEDTDTGEEATLRVLDAGFGIIGHEIAFCEAFSVGHERVPTVAGGVFHAWYVSRLLKNEAEVVRETGGAVSRRSYLEPLEARLRAAYGVDY